MKNFNGFFLDEENAKINSLAQLTLYSSLKSYFKTADDVSSFFHRYINIDDTERNGNLKSAPEYVIDACDSIIHFQHFLELYVKDILKSIHPLLVYDLPKSNKKHMILYDLIKGNKVKNAILENVYFIEFSCAYERLKELIKALKIEKYTFILKHFDMMKEVNNLRNRTQHRGLFVLEYFELDRLFGEHIFPFLIAMQEYDDNYKDVLVPATMKSGTKPTYAKTSVTPSKGSSYITVSKTGKVTVKKGIPKGSYTVKVKVTAKATTNYKAKTETKSLKIVVK